MKYDVKIISEDDQSLHYRITQGDNEIVSGGVSREEYEAERKNRKKGKSATVFALAKQRMPELFGKGTVVSDVVDEGDTSPITVGDVSATVDEVVHVIAGHDHDEYDERIRRVEAAVHTAARPDVTMADLMGHQHPPHEHEVTPHGHQALDVRLRAIEAAVETAGSHTHPTHKHDVIPHEHPEIYKLNEAIIALAEELRETRRTFLGHDHKHRHDELENKFTDHLAWAAEHAHPHDHPVAVHDHPVGDHAHPPHDHYDPRVELLESTVAAIKAKPVVSADFRVLSRENRGGREIIIAEEIR